MREHTARNDHIRLSIIHLRASRQKRANGGQPLSLAIFDTLIEGSTPIAFGQAASGASAKSRRLSDVDDELALPAFCGKFFKMPDESGV